MSTLRDSVVLISGASSGLGEFLAREFVARGARVGLLARRADRLEALAADLGECAAWQVADVTDREGFSEALDRLADTLGGCDVIVANAGYGRPEAPHKFKPGTATAMYDTNVFGMLHMIDWAMPRFVARRSGHIVGIASLASYVGMPNSPSYCGSKAAMRVHLQSLRVSLHRYGIAVTTISPGFVESELTARNKAPMPFMWKTDRAARRMADAIEQRRGELVFPWQTGGLIRVLARVPVPITEFFLRRVAPRARPYQGPESDAV
ncbi:MAG: SDR family NAD(P)-dependent oxidoreductase [Acidobacteriota bacterium]